MPKTGSDLGSDLKVLLEIANVNLPSIAGAFEKAAGRVADTNQTDSVAFSNGVVAAWQTFRNEYLALLSQSQGNVQDCSTTLVSVVNDYAAQDKAAADQLKGLMDEYNENHPDIKGPGKDGKYAPPKFEKPEYIDYIDEPEQLPRGDQSLK